jgi:hypothetical protein
MKQKVFLEKLNVTQLVKKSVPFMEPKCSVPSTEECTRGPYPVWDEFSSQLHILFVYNPF